MPGACSPREFKTTVPHLVHLVARTMNPGSDSDEDHEQHTDDPASTLAQGAFGFIGSRRGQFWRHLTHKLGVHPSDPPLDRPDL